MTRIIAILMLLSLAVFGSATSSFGQDWVEDRPEDGAFRAEFPDAPEVKSIDKPGGAPPVRMALVRRGSVLFMTIRYSVGPEGAKNADAMLNSARDTAIERTRSRLREERPVIVSGMPARRLLLDTPKGVAVVVTVVKGEFAYQAMYAGPLGTETSADAERFLASFALVGR
jgi:hypothetical protein